MKTVIKWLVIALIAVIAVFGAVKYKQYANADEMTAEEYLSRIEALMEEDKYDESAKLCTQALKSYADNVQLYIRKAESYKSLGDTDRAYQTLCYGYKQTNSDEIKQMLAEYPSYDESDASFESTNSIDNELNNSSMASAVTDTEDILLNENSAETYTEYTLPDVQIPEVTTATTTTTAAAETEAPQESGE